MSNEEIKEAIDNMSEEELNEYVFFVLKEMTKKCETQQDRIKELEMTLARYTAQTLNADIKQMHKHNEDLEMLYNGCQIELEEKDKIIDRMADFMWDYDCCSNFPQEYCKDCCDLGQGKQCIKDYFKKKVEDK